MDVTHTFPVRFPDYTPETLPAAVRRMLDTDIPLTVSPENGDTFSMNLRITMCDTPFDAGQLTQDGAMITCSADADDIMTLVDLTGSADAAIEAMRDAVQDWV